MTERWLPIEGYEGLYDVSDLGRVRSHYHGGRILKPCKDKDGYLLVALNRNGVRKTHVLHTLVCRAFKGPPNALHREVGHLDGTRDNCRADNLKWVGKVESEWQKRQHGTNGAGERHPGAKLTEANVLAIRHACQPHRVLAERYGVSHYTISDIKRGKRWRSVHDGPTAEGGDAQ